MKAQLTRIITGLVIAGIGAGLLLDNANIIEFGAIATTWWPLVVILAGVLIFLNDTKSYVWALLVAGAGVLFQLRTLDIIDINPWQFFWPAVIIAVGVSIIFSRMPRSKVSKSERDDMTAILGASDLRSASSDFKGSKITAVMGGVKLDLSQAIIKKEATIEIFSFCGGVEIIVPREVTVRNQTTAILGGVEDRSARDTAKAAPVLYITGDVVMAGVEIKT